MTAYHGGKQRIGKKIAKRIHEVCTDIEDEYNFTIKGYCEPFAGMLGVYRHIPILFDNHKPHLKYKTGEINKSIVKMWNASKHGWKPPTNITREKFATLKTNGKTSKLKGFVGHAYTFRGIFFNSYFNHTQSRIEKNSKNVQDIGKILKETNTTIVDDNYKQFSNLKGYVIYCDPPYANFSQKYYTGITYSNKLTFDHKKFWKWCKKMSKDNIVIVSEYSAPKDVDYIWSKPIKLGFGNGKKVVKRTEKLYLLY